MNVWTRVWAGVCTTDCDCCGGCPAHGLTLLQVCVRLKQKGDVITLTVLSRGAEAWHWQHASDMWRTEGGLHCTSQCQEHVPGRGRQAAPHVPTCLSTNAVQVWRTKWDNLQLELGKDRPTQGLKLIFLSNLPIAGVLRRHKILDCPFLFG